MSNEHDTLGAALVKVFAWFGAWLGTVSIADFQPIVAVISGSLVGLLAVVNLIKAVWPKKGEK